MFRNMRRLNQALSEEASIQILRRGSFGVMAVSGDDGYPYTVPLSYVYFNEKLYFHCAKAGHKLDAITANDKVSFCVVDQDEVDPDLFTSLYRSVIVFGKAHIIKDEETKRFAMAMLAEKYSPNRQERRDGQISRQMPQLGIIELTIEHISGKEAKRLANQRQV